LDRDTAETWRRVIVGEIDKVKRRETVIAVSRPANAGKSTNVNAITGAETMPVRASPMTFHCPTADWHNWQPVSWA